MAAVMETVAREMRERGYYARVDHQNGMDGVIVAKSEAAYLAGDCINIASSRPGNAEWQRAAVATLVAGMQRGNQTA